MKHEQAQSTPTLIRSTGGGVSSLPPDVDCARVVLLEQDEFRGAVPPRHDVARELSLDGLGVALLARLGELGRLLRGRLLDLRRLLRGLVRLVDLEVCAFDAL